MRTLRIWAAVAGLAACGTSSTDPPAAARRDRDAAAATVDAGAGCPDPHVGLWVGRSYEVEHWNEFRISLRRTSGDLACFEETRWWDAPADAARPPPCPSGGPAWGVTRLRCEARVVGDQLEVRTVTVLSETHTCGGATGNYIHDWFHGAVAGNTWTASNRFQDVDGAQVEQPSTFHRLSCAP